MVRLALRSSDMTATCAVPPGNPTSQTTGSWQTLLHEGNSGLVQCVFSAVEDCRNEYRMCMCCIMKGRRGQVGMCMYLHDMCSLSLSYTHTEENRMSSWPRATARAPVLLENESNGFHMPLRQLLTTTMGLMSPGTRGLMSSCSRAAKSDKNQNDYF